MLWNTFYDQWCIYHHPYHQWRPAGQPHTGGSCSSFSVWGDEAGGDGFLLMGRNEDNLNLPGLLDNRIQVLYLHAYFIMNQIIAKPANGFAFWCCTFAGLLALDGGMNASGIGMMTQYCPFIHETMEGCGIAVLTRLVLTHAKNLKDAYQIFTLTPRCTGIAYHVNHTTIKINCLKVVDGNSKDASVFECSATLVQTRNPAHGRQALFQSNHSNCYPGWEGYQVTHISSILVIHIKGYNMVADQAPVWGINASSIESWQNSLRDHMFPRLSAPARFERYRQLIEQYRGRITPEVAQQILRDRFDPYTGQTRDEQQPLIQGNILGTIAWLGKDVNLKYEKPGREPQEISVHTSNLWSSVLRPASGDVWIAIKEFPACYGEYHSFNLFQEVQRLKTSLS